MSFDLPFSEAQRDCMQELVNVAMGAAGESLAEYTGAFVELPVPDIRCVAPGALYEGMPHLQNAASVSGAVQSFSTDGGTAYALVVVADEALADLAILRGLAIDEPEKERDLLVSLTHVICDTCLATLAEITERDFATEPVFVTAMHQPLQVLFLDDLVAVDSVTAIEVPYQVENHPFKCDLLLLFPETIYPALQHLLDQAMS